MFVDEKLMDVWKITEITKNENNKFSYPGKDILYMLATTSWIFLKQEGKAFKSSKKRKYNIFYSNSIGTIMYVPAFMCIDFHSYEGMKLNKQIPNYNLSNTEYNILNKNAFDFNSYDKMEIYIDLESENLLNYGEKIYNNILQIEKQQKLLDRLSMDEATLKHTIASEKFELILNDFSSDFQALLKKYNIELYYNYSNNNTSIKYDGVELEWTIDDFTNNID